MSAVVATAKKKFSYQDYLATPDDARYELLNGILCMSPAPVEKHQRIAGEIYAELRNFIKKNKLGRVYIAPFDVYFDEFHLTEPDIFFVSTERENIITEKNVKGSPDLIIEVLSAGSIYRDTVEKKNIYEKFSVREYWIVFPDEELLEIYCLKNNSFSLYNTLGREGILESPLLKGLKINLKEVF